MFCKACLIGFSTSLGKVTCPTCSNLLTVDWTTKSDTEHQASKTTLKGFRASSILNRIKLSDFQTSTKIEALVCALENLQLMYLPQEYPSKFLWSFELFLPFSNYFVNCDDICMQREEIRFMVERDGSAKAIVFSQFTSFLDLINYTLGKVISGETH